MTGERTSFESAKGPELEYALDCFYRTYHENLRPEDGPPRPRDEVMREMRSYLGPQYKPGILSRLIGEGEVPPYETFIAKDGKGGRLGCLVLRINIEGRARTAWVYLVFVEPEARRRGLAKEMMAKAEEWGRSHGASSMRLSVATCNLAAFHLYESAGYASEKIWMRKRL